MRESLSIVAGGSAGKLPIPRHRDGRWYDGLHGAQDHVSATQSARVIEAWSAKATLERMSAAIEFELLPARPSFLRRFLATGGGMRTERGGSSHRTGFHAP